MPKITVIVPIYNGEKFIKKCVNSILNQTYEDYELLLINDGSTDASGTICDDYQKKDKRIVVIHKSNGGASSARICGVENACGKYVAFVDVDDWIDKDFLESLVTPMEMHEADIVACGCIKEKEREENICLNNIPVGIYECEELVDNVYSKMLWYEGFFKFGILPYMCNKIFKRTLLEEIYKVIDKRIYDGEDVVTVFSYLLECNKIVISDVCKYHYNLHNGSMSAKKKETFYENVSRLYLNLYENIRKTEYYHIMLPQLDQYMRYMIWMGKPQCFSKPINYIFPFAKVPQGAKIILYAAGNVGRAYYQQLKKTQYCNLVAWVDQRYKSCDLAGLNIEDPDLISKKQFEYLIIAIDNISISNEVKKSLNQKGVPDCKIIQINENERL